MPETTASPCKHHAEFAREVYDTYRSEGIGPALGKFAAGAGLDRDPPQPPVDPTPEMAEAMARMQGNMDFFFRHMWLPLGDYAPDVTRLRSLPITVAVGEASEGQLIQEALGATAVDAQWVMAYTLLLASLVLVGGSLGDHLGRPRVFSGGVGLFALASVWCGLSLSSEQLIAARALQGVGAALQVPNSLAIIGASFEEAQQTGGETASA